MELTNKLNLPDSIKKTLELQQISYLSTKKNNSLSVTQLLNPPYQAKLLSKHKSKIVQDISDNIWLLLGSAVHEILEKGETSDQLIEERFYSEIDGVNFSGMIDVFAGSKLSDWKVTSVYAVDNIERVKKWTEQLNCYAFLLSENGFEVKEIEVVAILRDWGRRHAGKHPAQVEIIKLDLWSKKDQLGFIKERIKLHTSDNIEICNPAERWQKPEQYAVMKKGRKRAIKLYDSLVDAENRAVLESEKSEIKHFIEVRKSEPTRCINYCSVNKWCGFYKEYLATVL